MTDNDAEAMAMLRQVRDMLQHSATTGISSPARMLEIRDKIDDFFQEQQDRKAKEALVEELRKIIIMENTPAIDRATIILNHLESREWLR